MKYKPLIIGTIIYYLLISFVFATLNLLELTKHERSLIMTGYACFLSSFMFFIWLFEFVKNKS